jgi:hypothetical protein
MTERDILNPTTLQPKFKMPWWGWLVIVVVIIAIIFIILGALVCSKRKVVG